MTKKEVNQPVVSETRAVPLRRWKPYSEYKDSGVEWLGDIPAHWEVVRVKLIAGNDADVVQTGPFGAQLHASDYVDEGVPLILIRNVNDLRIDSTDIPKISEEKANSLPLYHLKEGDIVFSRVGSIGRVALVTEHEKGWLISGQMLRLRIKSSRLNSRFAVYAYSSDAVLKFIELKSVGSTRESINTDILRNMPIPLPPLPEQSLVTDFLDQETTKLDILIAKKERLIELLQEKRTALISHTVTKGLDPDALMKDSGIEWLGKIPTHWIDGIKMNMLATDNRWSFVNGPFGSDLLTSELTDTGVPVIYIRDIKAEGYQRISTVYVTSRKAVELDFCRVDPGDVIIAKVGDPPGTATVYPPNEPAGIVIQDVIRIKPNTKIVVAKYLTYLLNSKYGGAVTDNISVISTRTRIGLGDFKNVRVVLPPLGEQEAIVAYLDQETVKIDVLIATTQETIEKLKEYRTALISAAVTGKIDVRETISTHGGDDGETS